MTVNGNMGHIMDKENHTMRTATYGIMASGKMD
jgi:hypothetical protein